MQRLLTALILAPVLWAAIKLAPPIVFILLALAIIAIDCWEGYRMLGAGGHRPFAWLGLAGAVAAAWSFAGMEPLFETFLPVLLVGILSFALAMWRRENPRAMLDTTVYTLFPVVFIGLGLGYAIALRNMPGEDGEDLLLLLFICVFFADGAAYYVGSQLGRHRLAPRLSPKKSWEGAAGGLVASVLGALLAHYWFYQRLPLGHAVVLGLLLGAAGILGDLAESTVKRATGVKDSSSMLPGHGGMLDRTDSLLFSAAVLFYYYRAFL